MADPASLVGLGAGLISLGLQTYSGITNYLDAIKCRDGDLLSVRRKNSALQNVLVTIKQSLPHLTGRHSFSISAAAECLQSCEAELKGLQKLAAELVGCDTAAPGWKKRMKRTSKTLTYAFDRSRLQELEIRLDQTTSILQLAVQTLGLRVSPYEHPSNVLTVYRNVSRLTIDKLTSIQAVGAVVTRNTGTISAQVLAGKQEMRSSFERQRKEMKQLEKLVGRLVAKPADLKMLCDQVENANKSLVKRSSTASPRSSGDLEKIDMESLLPQSLRCSCRKLVGANRRTQRRSQIWGPAYFYQETQTEHHLPECPLFHTTLNRRKQKAGVIITSLSSIVGAAIEISFAMTSGAGGWGSVKHGFAYRPTVDTKTAPAFRIVALLLELATGGYQPGGLIEMDQATQYRLTRTALKKIVRLFQDQTRKANPLDVDSKNQSLMHHVTQMIHGIKFSYPRIAAHLLEWFSVLFGCGVPASDYDANGWLPVQYLLELDDPTESQSNYLNAIESFFSPAACDSSIAIERLCPTIGWKRGNPHRLPVFRRSQECAEAYGNGPLSLAALANDLQRVKHLLKHHPIMLKEQNAFGQTPLHLSADNPACLRILAQAADEDLLNHVDSTGVSALDLAMALSFGLCARFKRLCSLGIPVRRCRRCSCGDCVIILLKSDCALPMSETWDSTGSGCVGTARYRTRYMRHLKDRRERLKHLALEHLSPLEQHKYGLQTNVVLDFHAAEVQHLLSDRGVRISGALNVGLTKSNRTSVYSNAGSQMELDVADALFNLGFRDTDILKDWRPRKLGTLFLPQQPNYWSWLFSHGADAFRLLEQSVEASEPHTGKGLFTGHVAFFSVGVHISQFEHAAQDSCDAAESLGNAILPANLTDNCRCACSPEGCSPVVYCLKGGLFIPNPYRARKLHSVDIAVRCLKSFGISWREDDHIAAVRFMTFQALGLTHVCCKPAHLIGKQKSNPDGSYIQEEEAALIKGFEEVVADLAADIRARLRSPSPRAELLDLWENIWPRRMVEEKEKLDGNNLSEAEKRAAEEIGVVWDIVSGCEVKPDKSGNPYDKWSQPEWWFYELDEIAPG